MMWEPVVYAGSDSNLGRQAGWRWLWHHKPINWQYKYIHVTGVSLLSRWHVTDHMTVKSLPLIALRPLLGDSVKQSENNLMNILMVNNQQLNTVKLYDLSFYSNGCYWCHPSIVALLHIPLGSCTYESWLERKHYLSGLQYTRCYGLWYCLMQQSFLVTTVNVFQQMHKHGILSVYT